MVSSAANAEHIKVFLLAGQSNMDGRADPLGLPDGTGGTVDLQSPQTDVLLYEGSLTDLQPIGGEFGPEVTFGRTIADALPGENFALIKRARGGSTLHTDWAPTAGTDYVAFKNRVTAGLTALEDGGTNTVEIVGMLWTQGERDGIENRTTAQYEADLNAFIADIRLNYGSDLPFFISRLSDNQSTNSVREAQFDQIQAAQDNVAAGDLNAYLIDTNSFSVYANDAIHFDAAGQIALGEAFAQSYLTNMPEPGSLVLIGLGGLMLAQRRRRH